MKTQLRNILIITSGIAAGILGLHFFVGEPRARNFSNYTEYQSTELKGFKAAHGDDPQKWSEAAVIEYTRQEKEFMCLDRYMSANHPFAEAVTNCKQESLLP